MKVLLPLFILFSVQLCSQSDDQDGKQLMLVQVPGIGNSDRVSDIQIEDGQVLIASKGGVSSPDNSSSITTNQQRGEATAVKMSKSGSMFVGYQDNSIYIDDYKVFTIDSDTVHISDIEEYGNKMYVGTNDGVFIFDLASRRLAEHMNTNNSKLKSNKINFLHHDAMGRLWFGTDKGGMFQKGVNKGFSNYYDEKDNYIGISENEKGIYLISDKDVFLIQDQYKGTSWTPLNIEKGLYKGPINDIVVDNEGSLFIASDMLVKFNPYKNTTEQYLDQFGIASQKVLSLGVDKNNVIWVGTEDAGLLQLKYDTVSAKELILSSILASPISCPGAQDASINISVTGGTKPYTYSWDPVRLQGNDPGLLRAGDYSLTVTDANGASKQTTITISAPEPIRMEVVNTTKASSATKKDGTCELDISGGTSPYSIAWDNGEIGTKASKLIFGFHYITITDNNGCTSEQKINIKKSSSMASLNAANLVVGEKLRLDNLYFEADSSGIQDKSIDALEDVFTFLQENNTLVIEIGGHTNGIPPHEYCDKLSSARAMNVADYLVNRGIAQDRITHKGYGKREPIATNQSQAGRRRNQRVEMKIIDIKTE